MRSVLDDNQVEREALQILHTLSQGERLRLLISQRTSGVDGEWYDWSRAYVFDERDDSTTMVPLRAALLCMARLWVVPVNGGMYTSHWELAPSGRSALDGVRRLAA